MTKKSYISSNLEGSNDVWNLQTPINYLSICPMAAISMTDTDDAIKRSVQTSLSNRFLFMYTNGLFQWFAEAPSSFVFVTKQMVEKLTKKEKPKPKGGPLHRRGGIRSWERDGSIGNVYMTFLPTDWTSHQRTRQYQQWHLLSSEVIHRHSFGDFFFESFISSQWYIEPLKPKMLSIFE